MTERWVNAVIEITVPLDVPVTAGKFEKQEAVGVLMERLLEEDLPEEFAGYVGTGRWEDANA